LEDLFDLSRREPDALADLRMGQRPLKDTLANPGDRDGQIVSQLLRGEQPIGSARRWRVDGVSRCLHGELLGFEESSHPPMAHPLGHFYPPGDELDPTGTQRVG
jgi:hypothetical protein